MTMAIDRNDIEMIFPLNLDSVWEWDAGVQENGH